MLEWINSHHQILSVLLSLGMLIVWIAYLQIFITSYRRQTRPKILINRGGGRGPDARCLVSNMSGEAIYIQSIIVKLETRSAQRTCPVTELDGIEEWDETTDLKLKTRQGPLQAGSIRDMGSFKAMLDHVLQSQTAQGDEIGPDAWDELTSFEVQIIAAYGSEDLLIGAKRRFDVVRDNGNVDLRAHTIGAEQIRSRRERQQIAELLKDDL